MIEERLIRDDMGKSIRRHRSNRWFESLEPGPVRSVVFDARCA